MTEYDFRTLSPIDFEMLVCQLLRPSRGWKLEAFDHGPDGGVDLRCTLDNQKIVVQCKHYWGSSFSDLRKSARKEVQKMNIEKPTTYLFATSQNLSLTQKDTLMSDLKPWIKDTSDILAGRDLNLLLSEHPSVEQANFKLWMASAGVLEKIVRSGLWQRSEALLEEIQDRIQMYVPTGTYNQAVDMLEKNSVCVLTGAPGVGKSMLADMLALNHWEKEWQIVTLASHEIDLCWDAWKRDDLQLFYFDDVFGQTDIHERLGRDSGVTIAKFIRRVSGSPSKRLVITTRTHVLHEAELRDEPVARSGLRARECVVQVRDYGDIHRAKVLYNHLYFSKLERDTIRDFLNAGGHWHAISHPNFTPRIIEQIVLHHDEASDKGLQARMQEALDHPLLLWGPSFREALTASARAILLQLVAFPPYGADIDMLRTLAIQGHSPMDYTRGSRQLEGSWISIRDDPYQGPRPVVRFTDPSCRDFVLAFLDSEPDYFWELFAKANEGSQIALLLGYCLATADTQGTRKYPKLYATLMTRREYVGDQVKYCWTANSTVLMRTVAQSLRAISDANAEIELGISDWVHSQTIRLGAQRPRNEFLDAESAGFLLGQLMEIDRHPATSQETAELLATFNDWCNAIGADTEWDDSHRFLGWIDKWGDPETITEANKSFRLHYDMWLPGELESIVENADTADNAHTWLGDVEGRTETYFGSSHHLENEFSSCRSSIEEKFDSYEPSSEDIANLRTFGDEDDAYEPEPHEIGHRAAANEAKIQRTKQIESMFGQLS